MLEPSDPSPRPAKPRTPPNAQKSFIGLDLWLTVRLLVLGPQIAGARRIVNDLNEAEVAALSRSGKIGYYDLDLDCSSR